MERCVFDLDEQRCSALTKKECDGCRFHKTVAQVAEGRRRSEERLDANKTRAKLMNGTITVYSVR